MKQLTVPLLLLIFASLLPVSQARADADPGCGSLIEGKWNVKKAGEIKHHLKHRLIIEKTGNGTYSVKIKNQNHDTAYKSKTDFNLSCDSGSNSATLTGDIKMGKCMHSLEVKYPYQTNNVSIRITSSHGKGECKGHKDASHESDRLGHSTQAYGKRPGK